MLCKSAFSASSAEVIRDIPDMQEDGEVDMRRLCSSIGQDNDLGSPATRQNAVFLNVANRYGL